LVRVHIANRHAKLAATSRRQANRIDRTTLLMKGAFVEGEAGRMRRSRE